MSKQDMLMVGINEAIGQQNAAAERGDVPGYMAGLEVEAYLLARLVLVYYGQLSGMGRN